MSSIPSAKMKHAHAHEGDHPEQAQTPTHQAEAQGGETAKPANDDKPSAAISEAGYADSEPGVGAKIGKRARDLGEEAVDAVKARPRTAAAIGAAIIAGAAALVGAPAAARALRGAEPPKKPAAKRKPAAKKTGAKKG